MIPKAHVVKMATEVPSTEISTAASSILRVRLQHHCVQALKQLVPEPGNGASGMWNEQAIRTLLAVAELQRAELLAESEEHHELINSNVVANILEVLSTRMFVFDPASINELELHLRLLTAMLRLYQLIGKSLVHQVHDRIYHGICKLDDDVKAAQKSLSHEHKIEGLNVAFQIQHALNSIIMIDSTDSFRRQLANRAMIGVDAALAGVGGQYDRLRPAVLEVIKRKRNRAKWHVAFVELEDACWCCFARDIRVRTNNASDIDIESLISEAHETSDYLAQIMQQTLPELKKPGMARNVFRRGVGKTTEMCMDSGPFQEHDEYLQFGILDLLYQLSFRIRKRARDDCFNIMLSVIRLVLEKAPSKSVGGLWLKASDLHNRISFLAQKEDKAYGEHADWKAIRKCFDESRRADGHSIEQIAFSRKSLPPSRNC
jgi:hypothetical protein